MRDPTSRFFPVLICTCPGVMRAFRRCSQSPLAPVHRIARTVFTRVVEVLVIEAEDAVAIGVGAEEEGKASNEVSESPSSPV